MTFAGLDDIRIAGSRIGIGQAPYHSVYQARTPEEIVVGLPTLTLEQAYATILSYRRNRAQIDAYLADRLTWSEARRAAQEADPVWRELAERMRQERARRRAPRPAAMEAGYVRCLVDELR